MTNSIYVGNLPYAATEDNLNKIFSAYGSVVSTKIIVDKDTGRSKGFGFVEMSNVNEVTNAVKELDNAELLGRNIKVNVARPRETKRDSYRY